MRNVRYDHKRRDSEYWISSRDFRLAYAYALKYNEWSQEAEALGGMKAVNYDGMPHGNSVGNPTESTGIKTAELLEKIRKIDNALHEAAPEIENWLKMYVTNEDITFDMLKARGIPCERAMFYNRRMKFYYLLSRRI